MLWLTVRTVVSVYVPRLMFLDTHTAEEAKIEIMSGQLYSELISNSRYVISEGITYLESRLTNDGH